MQTRNELAHTQNQIAINVKVLKFICVYVMFNNLITPEVVETQWRSLTHIQHYTKSKKLEIVHVFNCLIINKEVEIKLGQILWKKTDETTKGLIAQT